MKIAIFPGSFDPFTLAHKDLVDRGLGLFDKVIVAIGVNANKKGLMDIEMRRQVIKSVYADNPQIEVETFSGLTVDFCQQKGANFILRGLRNSNDFVYEDAIAQNNSLLAPQVETYFLLSRTGTAHISSTIVRDIWGNNGQITHLVPKEVLKALKKLA